MSLTKRVTSRHRGTAPAQTNSQPTRHAEIPPGLEAVVSDTPGNMEAVHEYRIRLEVPSGPPEPAVES